MARPRTILIACGGIVLAICLGGIIHALLTDTQRGQAHSMDELTNELTQLKVMRSFARSSQLWDFPYEYPVDWTRIRIRPTFHWSGKGDPQQIASFLDSFDGSAFGHQDKNGNTKQVSFVLRKSNVVAEGDIDIEDGSFTFVACYAEGAEPDASPGPPPRDPSSEAHD